MMLMDNDVICVANGGIETHPDYGREKLNLATMQPNIAFIDRLTGDLLSVRELPAKLHQVSLRHLAPDATGRVWVGAQYEGPAADNVPLLMRIGVNEDFFIPDIAPETLQRADELCRLGRLLRGRPTRHGRIAARQQRADP